MDTCIFCEIVARRAPASIVAEDDWCLAFLDIRPVTRGHTLVIPKTHAALLSELEPALGGRMFQMAQRIAQALRTLAQQDQGFSCEAVNLMLADGAAAGQEVGHVHLHILPRYRGDGFGFHFGRKAAPGRSELDDLASELRAAL
ncbi:MAG: HIT family protein [Anaerolineales bacterium]|nr:HIT family protein [Anaerolineales bacterium]